MYQKIRLTALLTFVIMTGAAYAAEITDVMVRQRWPWSRKVDIDYVLNCDAGREYDIKIEAYDGLVPLNLPIDSLLGDITKVKSGTRRIVWDPTATEYANDGSLVNFKVKLSLVPIPLYMIVNINNESGEAGQIEYVYEDEIINGDWGTWERNPITNDGSVIESVIWTGVTNDNVYRTDKVVLRRVEAGSFLMGEGSKKTKYVTLTKDFYIGVFHVTQQQWKHVRGSWGEAQFTNETSRAWRPMEFVKYRDDIRGLNFGTNWPGVDGKGDYRVDGDSFLGELRDKTGVSGFDLPTEAQWEYACRAGTTTCFNDGIRAADVSTPNNLTNVWMDVLGRYRYNHGYADRGVTAPLLDCGPEHGTAIVGSYKPNAWGIYDMHGNLHELCLDWYADSLPDGDNPTGALSGSERVRRGGYWSGAPGSCTSFGRWGIAPTTRANTLGLRLAVHLP